MWRSTPYPDTEDEIKYYKEYFVKHSKATDMMSLLGLAYEKITRYPGGFPDGLISIHTLYDIFSDEEKVKEIFSKLKE